MALSDTARLIASLELQDKFSKNAAAFERSVDSMSRKTAGFDKLGNDIGRGLRSTTQNLGRIGIVGAGLLAAAVTNGVQELEKLESATAQTNAVLESTQGVSGQTAESIRKLAEKYEGLNALIDDKVIQSGENVLLTFTNVRKEAFEPALQAALDLNQALGGGEEGLQGTIIQVGKALSDPIRGLTSLRRVGVVFTKDQEKQIRTLVESNDLYGAQQVILQELAKEFGGSFAAAGDTAAGKFAKVKDAVEDAQAALATAFLPLLEKVADKLGTFLADPATIQRIQDFGGQLAGGFEKILEVGGSLPWQQIGDAFKIVGTGSKALLDAFLGLPPWVQTAVLTGWGLNKLTGGALTSIVGDIGKIAFGGGLLGRGSSPANPLWVQSVGGGIGGPGGPGGLPLLGLGLGPILLAAATIGAVAAGAAFAVSPDRSPEFGSLEGRGGPGRNPAGRDPLSKVETAAAVREGTAALESEFSRSRATGQELARLASSESIKRNSDAARTLDALRGQAGSLIRIAEKNFSPNVSVNVSAVTNVSVNPLQRTLTSARIAGSGTIGGFTESAF